jgi:transcriptional regulator with XRE-family HTH domain
LTKLDPSQAGQDRQDLAAALRDLRKASGLSGDRLAVRCGMSQSKLSRIETGRLLPSVVDVQLIIDALGVDEETRDDLLKLAHVANAEYQDVRADVRRGIHHKQRQYASLEAGAEHMRHFLPTLITGLLQVPEYMQAALAPPAGPISGEVSQTLALKLGRQAVLHDRAKRFEFLLTESALRWRICRPSVMALQLDRVVSVSRLPNVRVGVLPLDAFVPDGAYHSFVLYDDKLVTAELFSGQIALRDPKDVEFYSGLFEFFSDRAKFGDDARSLIEAWGEQFRQEA